jgi:CheY-like chemotaxis protein
MTYQFENTKILIVDDMPPMLTLTASLLEFFGFRNIDKATSADRALEMFIDNNYDLIVTDWQIGPYDGVELTRRIRNEVNSPNRFIPIIMMSGFSHKIRVEQARDVGITEFLVKPFRAIDLYKRIEILIEKPRRFVEAEEFFGPDRRRKKGAKYQGPFRRDEDEFAAIRDMENDKAATLLKELKDKARDKKAT